MAWRYITYKGEAHTIPEWARRIGISYWTLRRRIIKGWPLEKAMSPKLYRNPAGVGCVYNGYRFIRGRPEHRLFAEKVLGKALPRDAVIHHVNGDSLEHIGNMVICENHSYHQLLHQRKLALEKCGNPSWRICRYCKKYDDIANLTKYKSDKSFHHKTCRREYRRNK